jgi:glycosyltransferase involved in cell wall biosynthesis
MGGSFMNFPLLSIITPSLNQLPYLKVCVASVEMQSYPNCEQIVLDANSGDGSKEYLKKYPGCVTWWRSHPDKGQSQALNEGFSQAKGEWIGWQNSDDFYYPGAFALVAQIIQKFPQTQVIVGDTTIVDETGMITNRIGVSPVPARSWLKGYWPYNQSLFIRNDILKSVLPLDEGLCLHMDTDFLAKIALLAPIIAYTPHCLGAFRKHRACKTENPDLRARSRKERDLLIARYRQTMWPKTTLSWQVHRLSHHYQNIKAWGLTPILKRLVSKIENPCLKGTVLK